MIGLNEKLQLLQKKVMQTDEPIRIMIIGLGSVGLYLLDYLLSTSDSRLEIIAVGRNCEKMQSDVNIVRTAAAIRRQMVATVHIEANCDLENVDDIAAILKKWNPDFVVNSSRVYSGLKYGSISWSRLRAYGIWTPLSVRYARNIMVAYAKAESHAIAINTSYSDAVIPWLRHSGLSYFDFGSGNLNHLIPRMKFYVSEMFDISNVNDIDISLAVSHFHDVVISKEGHAEGQDILLDVKYKGETLNFDKEELLAACKIAMPVDHKRNMMNASSNFDIINSILKAIRERCKIRIHTPGVNGEIGGYPFVIDAENLARGYVDESVFSFDDMRKANMTSIYLDGIESVNETGLTYTDELLEKVQKEFNVVLPKTVSLDESADVAAILINDIILPSVRETV